MVKAKDPAYPEYGHCMKCRGPGQRVDKFGETVVWDKALQRREMLEPVKVEVRRSDVNAADSTIRHRVAGKCKECGSNMSRLVTKDYVVGSTRP